MRYPAYLFVRVIGARSVVSARVVMNVMSANLAYLDKLVKHQHRNYSEFPSIAFVPSVDECAHAVKESYAT